MIGQLNGHVLDRNKKAEGDGMFRLRQTITTILIELWVQIGQRRQNDRPAPLVAFKL